MSLGVGKIGQRFVNRAFFPTRCYDGGHHRHHYATVYREQNVKRFLMLGYECRNLCISVEHSQKIHLRLLCLSQNMIIAIALFVKRQKNDSRFIKTRLNDTIALCKAHFHDAQSPCITHCKPQTTKYERHLRRKTSICETL